MNRGAIVVVDPYSTSRMLPSELGKYGINCVTVRSSPAVPAFFKPQFEPGLFHANFVHENDVESTASNLEPHAPIAVLPGCEMGLPLADALNARLGLPGNDAGFSAARCDKYSMATTLASHGIRAIGQVVARSATEIEAWMRGREFGDIVVKPRDSAGTECVFFCRQGNDIARAVDAIVGRRNLFGRINEVAVAQERVRGEQYTVNTVSIDGQVFFGEVWTYETHEVAGAASVCAVERLLDGDDAVCETLRDYVRQVLAALRIRHGPAHVEVIVDAQGPVVVDIGARLQGTMSYRARLRALGHNHVTLTALRYAQPRRFLDYASRHSPYRRIEKAYCVSLISDQCGRVTGHAGFQAIRDLETYCDAISLAPAGSRIDPTRDLASTPGIVYLVSVDDRALCRDYETIRSMSMTDLFGLTPV